MDSRLDELDLKFVVSFGAPRRSLALTLLSPLDIGLAGEEDIFCLELLPATAREDVCGSFFSASGAVVALVPNFNMFQSNT